MLIRSAAVCVVSMEGTGLQHISTWIVISSGNCEPYVVHACHVWTVLGVDKLGFIGTRVQNRT